MGSEMCIRDRSILDEVSVPIIVVSPHVPVKKERNVNI